MITTIDHRMRILLDMVRRLLRRGAKENLYRILQKTHPADIAHLFRYLSGKEQRTIFDLIDDPSKAALTLSLAESSTVIQIIQEIEDERLVEMLRTMPSDDMADIIRFLPEDLSERILKMIKDESDEVEHLLTYNEDTAGSIMVTDFLALNQDITVNEAMAELQSESEKAESIFYIYVIDDFGRLVGVTSLRQLLTVPPATSLKEIMSVDVISVSPETDQEEVAKIVEKYDLLAVPVVDEGNKLVGLITVDDVIDIIREEATEDIYRMAGTNNEELVYGNKTLKISRVRLPWLLTNLIGGLITGYILWIFKAALEEVITLVAFIPVITAMGGNVGIQSSTIVVRGFATGRVDMDNIRRMIFKEFRIGIIMGIICGIFVGIAALLWHRSPFLGIVVSVAMMSAIIVAAVMGTAIPTLLKFIKVDPAIASGPFVTTANDITGILIYLGTALIFLNFL